MAINLKKDTTILFQGDSITDCCRNVSGLDEMGFGYAYMASSSIRAHYSDLNLTFINRGVSGNCIHDLLHRWERDCLQLKPDVVSILVGINDTWQAHEGLIADDNQIFYNHYHEMLQKTKEVCNPQFILCEPFLLHVSKEVVDLRESLDQKIIGIRKLAEEFSAVYVPFDTMFTEASEKTDPSYWAPDGVHPTPAGHALMAEEWIKSVFES